MRRILKMYYTEVRVITRKNKRNYAYCNYEYRGGFFFKFHYFFIIMENKSNENLMENQKMCYNSIKNEKLFPLEFLQKLNH